ncbi:MAG: biotin transporter BioY, partial [Candidatus Marinimicrobia bacterium]|nr:biotin transporter BioY [Candidatus Neomarinimicrobiota bacterium]
MKSAFNKVLPYQESEAVRTVVLVGGFALLTALGALIRIPLPFTPIPITLQTFFVLLAGAMLGSKRGTLSQMVYVFAGAAGIPIFAGMSSGLALLAGPTGGFLAGFLLAPS